MNIVVLAGGTSPEREISILSGVEACRALQKKGHKAVLVDAFFGLPDVEIDDLFTKEFDARSAASAMHANTAILEAERKQRREFFGPRVLEACAAADIVFLALHGEPGEDGRVQAVFDLAGIRYTGAGFAASALAMDKNHSKQIFQYANIATPRGTTVKKGQRIAGSKELGLELPVIVKPCFGGSSVGVTIAGTEAELQQGLELSFSYEPTAIVEEYISGREFAVAVVDGEAYPVIEIAPKEGFYDYHNKYEPGATVETCPADIPAKTTKKMQQMAVEAAAALGITGYCRLDFILRDDGQPFCLEANTLPGMTPLSLIPQEAAAAGIDFPSLCERLIAVSLAQNKKETP